MGEPWETKIAGNMLLNMDIVAFAIKCSARVDELRGMSAAVCAFESIDSCTRTVIEAIQAGIPLARCEIVCDTTIDAINRHEKTSYRVAPTLFFEFHGTKAGVIEQAETVQAIAKANGGMDFVWATHAEDRNALWEARHHAYFACLQLRPGSRAMTTDVCVPISRLVECVHETMADMKHYVAPVPLMGHIGDGNFHLMLLIDPASKEEQQLAEQLNKRVVARALAMGGTCTGEHGIGLGKQDSLVTEHGEETMALMREIKRLLDPENMMNPGKLLAP